MAEPIRRSDIAESDIEKGLYWLGGAVGLAVVGFLVYSYAIKHAVVGIAFILLTVTALGFAISEFYRVKKIPVVKVRCPYCNAASEFLETPKSDFTCQECHRRVAVDNGRILDVIEVKCGFCGSLQRFSERTEVALCEDCDHEIPLASSPTGEMRHMARGMAVEDDTKPYDLILIEPGTRMEEVTNNLQRVLALNRPQVKAILDQLPATLLTGVPKRKAQMLSDELTRLGARMESRVTAGK